MADQLLKKYGLSGTLIKAKVNVLRKSSEFVLIYDLDLPELGKGTKAMVDALKRLLVSDTSIKTEKMLDHKFIAEIREKFIQKSKDFMEKEAGKISEDEKNYVIEMLVNEMLGLGPIEFLLLDGNLEEIVVNSAKEPVWVYHKEFGWLKTNITFRDESEIQNYGNIIARRVGKQITVLQPLLDAHLVTGDRANATIFPISSAGNTITIRRFRREPWTVTDFIENNTTTSDVMALIWLCMQYELNMILSGGTASGKCLSGDSRVVVSGGQKAIKEIVENELNKSKPVQTEDGFFVTPANLEVFSFNPVNSAVEKAPVSFVWKRKAPQYLLKITTQTGKELEVTPEHPFFVLEDGVFKKKRADEIKNGDFVPSARKLDVQPVKGRTLALPKHAGALVVGNRVMRANCRSKKIVKLPEKMSCELARFIGYVLGDGHITQNKQAVRFFNNDKVLREDFRKCGGNLFGINGKFCQPKNRCPYIEFNSKIVSEFLVQNFEITPGKKSSVIFIPQSILFGEKEHLKEIVRGLFESEASVGIKKGELEFSSSSPRVIDDLSTALHRFGILHITKKTPKRNRLFIGGKNLQDFGKEIGFFRANKNDLILNSKKKTFSPNFDFVPNLKPVISELKQKLGLYEKEMRGTLSREAVSIYINGKRNPTRESLFFIAKELENRFFDLAAEKQKIIEIQQTQNLNRQILPLVKSIYKKINLTRKELAYKSKLDKNTLWLWETGQAQPTIESLKQVAEITAKEFDSYYQTIHAPVQSLSDARQFGVAVPEISQKTGIPERTVYKYFSEAQNNSQMQLLLSKVHEWQQQKLVQLQETKQQVMELKKILEINKPINFYKELKHIKRKLKLHSSLPVLRSEKIILQKLDEATSKDVSLKIQWLKELSTSNVVWDKIKKIKQVAPKEPWVYDLTVDGTHTFFANNMVAHNTSFLNICLPFIPPNHRVITIEDTRELLLPSFLHWVPMTTREPNPEGKGGIEMINLLVNSLRMRPDRIIVGEVRRQKEAEVMFEAMHTGHSVYTTVHANTAEETIKRLSNPPIEIPTTMLEGVHLDVVMFRNRRLGVRRVLELAEFIPEKRGGSQKEGLTANVLYKWHPSNDRIEKNAESIRLFDELGLHTGLGLPELQQDMAEKKTILEWMIKQDIRHVQKVGRVMATYYMDRDIVAQAAKKSTLPEWLK